MSELIYATPQTSAVDGSDQADLGDVPAGLSVRHTPSGPVCA